MLKYVFFIVVGMFIMIWALKACSVREKFEESPPVKYIESMPAVVDKAKLSSTAANRAIIMSAIGLYRVNEGDYPVVLSDLVDKGFLRKIPGGDWDYDGSGNLQ